VSPAVLFGRRARTFRLVLLVVFLGIAARLVFIQEFSHGHYAALSNAELSSTIQVPADRGAIYDRNGEILAESVNKSTVVADPYLIKHPASEAAALAPVLGVPASQLQPELSEHSGFVYLAHRVTNAVAAKVTALDLTGINLITEPQTVEPDGQLALPLIGTVGTAGTGQSGLEYQYQSTLAGKAGTETQLVSPDGVALTGASQSTTPAQPGTGIELTIDESLQYIAEQALATEIVAAKAVGGTAVVMDVKTGDILAMANLQATPSGSQSSGSPAASTDSVSTSGPTLTSPVDTLPAGVEEASSNTALTSVYEPGSVFKLVTFSAALADGVITPTTPLTVPGSLTMGSYTFHDAEPHGAETMTPTQILAQSSNLGTIEIAQSLGESRLLAQIGNLGFGKPTGLDYPGESEGLVPGADAWTQTSPGSTPIGQDDSATAQQVLDAYNAVANGGVFVQPKLVQATVTPNGTVTPTPPSASHRVIDPTTNAELTTMLESVVQSGTGTSAAIDGYTVAGKTGTAQIPNPNALGYIPGAYMATFAGFAPAQDPVLSAIVVLNRPTPIYGGSVAAPVFSTIMEYALHHYGIPTTTTATPSTASGALGGAGSITVTPNQATEG
jgi:cell division protein FtsI (penicillin-binding protein 3)